MIDNAKGWLKQIKWNAEEIKKICQRFFEANSTINAALADMIDGWRLKREYWVQPNDQS